MHDNPINSVTCLIIKTKHIDHTKVWMNVKNILEGNMVE